MTKHPFRTTLVLAATLALAATLPGCSRSPEDTPPSENMVEDNYQADPLPEPTPAYNAVPEAPPVTDMNATAEALPPPVAPSADEQMIDDASATGMTARWSRDEQPDEQPAGGNSSDQ